MAIVTSKEGPALLALDAAAKDFTTAAFAPCKYIGFGAEAEALFAQASIADGLDNPRIPMNNAGGGTSFIEACRSLRYWPREMPVDLDARPRV